MVAMMKKLLPFLFTLGLATGCHAGWLKSSQPGFVIQTYTSYQPISGNNSGVIVTNGNSYQFAGDNTGYIYIGGPGAQFRGVNDGSMVIDGNGAFVLGSFASLSAVTNRGTGSLILGNLSVGQRAVITDVGNASILRGAGTVSNSQAIVVGDGNESHGLRSVTADSFWGMGSGFHGDGAGLTLGGSLAKTNDTGAKIEVGGLAIGYQNLDKVGDRSLLLGAYGSALGQWAFGGGYYPIASDNMSFVWEGVGGAYQSHGPGTFNIRAPSIWFGETKAWDSSAGFLLMIPAASITDAPWATNTPAGIAAAGGLTNGVQPERTVALNADRQALSNEVQFWYPPNSTNLDVFTWTTNAGQITVTAWTDTNSTVAVIPDYINGLPVTAIGSNAFYANAALAGVTIPAGVTSIGNRAFEGCTALAGVAIPESVTAIGNAAFYFCTSLTVVTIPDSVTNIGNFAFGSCSGLTNVTMGSSVTSIGEYAFNACYALKSVYYSGNAPALGDSPFQSAPMTNYIVRGRTGFPVPPANFGAKPTAYYVPYENYGGGEYLTFGGYAGSWKTNVFWAYATSNATERTAYTNIYLGR